MPKIDYETFANLADEYRAMRGGILRLLTFGNAGGTIATLSFIGTMIGRSGDQTYDRAAFTVLCLFIVGLAAGWFGRMCEWRIVAHRMNLAATVVGTEQARSVNLEARTRWDAALDGAITSSFSLLGVGILLGLSKLFELSAP